MASVTPSSLRPSIWQPTVGPHVVPRRNSPCQKKAAYLPHSAQVATKSSCAFCLQFLGQSCRHSCRWCNCGAALADQWHVLPPGVPNLVVYTAFFYFSTMFFCECTLLHLSDLYSTTLPFHSAGSAESLSMPLLMCCKSDSGHIIAHSAAQCI